MSLTLRFLSSVRAATESRFGQVYRSTSTNWDHAALIEWLREWERYVEKMHHRCTTTGETYENMVATVKGCVKRKTLKNMASYVLMKPVADVTDADIMGAVQARCRTLKNEFVPDVTSLFRQKLKMDLSIDDCDARVFRYYEDFNGIMEDNDLQGLIGADNTTDAGFKNRMKARCRLLVENLQPPILKAHITRLIDLERRDCKSDDVALFDLILGHAKVQQRFLRMWQDYTAKGDSKAAKPDRKSQKTSHAGASAKAEKARSTPSAAQPSASAGCHEHCPTATDVKKETAQARYQAEKEQRTRAFHSKAAHTGTTRNIVRTNGLLEIPPSDQFALFPVSVTLADGRPEICGMEVVLDLELVTIAGHVSLRSVPCLILEGGGDEFLLGKDALKRLGIDVDQALAQVADSTLLADEDDEFPVGDELPNLKSTPIITLDQLLERAVANGLPQEHVIAVCELLELFPDIWRAVVGAGRTASVEPLRVTLRVDAKPYRSPPRKYAPLQAEFIRGYVKSLVADGLVEKNNAARLACAVVPVRKPGSRDKFRLTINYRPVNRQTIPIAGVMPSAAVAMEVLLGQKVFARFDLTQGFWQLPLHPDSQVLFSFVTPDGVYTPIPHGGMDSALHFQAQMQTLLAPLIPHSALVWVNDVILFASTMDEFLEVVKKFFTIVAEAKLVLNMEKGSTFELEILWRGRLFSADGVRHDPTRVDALSTLPLPVTVADLQRFIFATNWLHDSLPDYTRVIAPHPDRLEAEKKCIGRRNHPDAELCVFTDASLFGFSIVVTQEVTWQQGEAFPIVKACNDLEYLLLRPRGFRLFCDHANLIYIFAPHDELKKHVRDRLQRWAMRLRGLHYHVEHIGGDANVWADIVSRWHKMLPRHSRPLDVNEPGCKLIFWKRMGHRGQEAMSFALKDQFFIVKLEDKIAQFIRQCLLCKHFKGARLIPRPYGPLFTPTERNEVLHWDFLSLGDSYGDSAYLLVLKDGLSHYYELFPCATPTAYVAAEVLMMWDARFGTSKTLMSDQGSHFRNEMINQLAARLKIEPKFSPVYSPWLNGTVERLNRDVLQVLRALLLEYALDSHEWPYLLPAIQANLSHTPVRSLAGHSPVEVFTGLPVSSALDGVVAPATEAADERVIELGDMDGHLERLRTSLQEMHREVVDSKEKKRQLDMQAHKERWYTSRWMISCFGPVLTSDCRTTSYLGNGSDLLRLKFYADAALNTTEEIMELVSSQGMLLGVDKFIEHRYNQDFGGCELLVSWLGLQTIENAWEPLSTLLQDVPVNVREYVNASGSDKLCAQID
ncbi:Hypothetical protein PHPALM_9063 [Phytophthora palmivora]|uniref:Reverse transcriptase n=1 Tax=Phytophthora palmivora TaxID=4796 RepID=A0A2P4Y8M4_9STRA|nr:Hypothetical protein PHPALM_9063 [Phytophthora palmivora]